MSVATTVPVAPTRPASQVGTDAPPAPTSQQRQPLAMPIDVNVSNVLRSKRATRAAKRSSACLGASASGSGRCRRGHRATSSVGWSASAGAAPPMRSMSAPRSGPGSAFPPRRGQSFGDSGLGEVVTEPAQRLRHGELVAEQGRGPCWRIVPAAGTSTSSRRSCDTARHVPRLVLAHTVLIGRGRVVDPRCDASSGLGVERLGHATAIRDRYFAQHIAEHHGVHHTERTPRPSDGLVEADASPMGTTPITARRPSTR